MTTMLAPLPSAIGVFPQLVAQKPETLIMKAEHLGRDFKISLHDGTPIISVDAGRASLSHRKTIRDASGNILCQIRKTNWSMSWTYFAEQSEDAPTKLFELKSHSSLTGSRNDITFANVAGDGTQTVLTFKSHSFNSGGEVLLNGKAVAMIERKKFKMRSEYHLHVAPGLDMFLIAAIALCLNDKAKTRAAASAAAGAGASG